MIYFRGIRLILATFLVLCSGLLAFGQEEGLDLGPISRSPAQSPDSSLVAFASDFGLGPRFDIWLANSDGTEPVNLTELPESDELQPDWMPDGERIIFSSDMGGDTFDIWTIGINGQGLSLLATSDGDNTYPRVSPDGTGIVFLSNRTGKRELWTMKIDGMEQSPIALISMLVSDPSWSPDGMSVVFVGCRLNACNLFQTTLAGTVNQITSGDFQDWNPDWGASGIIFASNRDQSQSIWLVQPNGTGLQVFNNDSSGALDPRWGPGDEIVFGRAHPDDDAAAAQIWIGGPNTLPSQITEFRDPIIVACDLDADGDIDRNDISAIVSLRRTTSPPSSALADFNDDGRITISDARGCISRCTLARCAIQ